MSGEQQRQPLPVKPLHQALSEHYAARDAARDQQATDKSDDKERQA